MRVRHSCLDSEQFAKIHLVGWISAAGLFTIGFGAHWLDPRATQELTRQMEMWGLGITGVTMTADIVWTVFRKDDQNERC